MNKEVIAEQGDTLDALLHTATGSTNGIEQLMMSTPELVSQLIFDAGTHVVLDVSEQTTSSLPIKKTIHLWD